jgi:hypothetical protein
LVPLLSSKPGMLFCSIVLKKSRDFIAVAFGKYHKRSVHSGANGARLDTIKTCPGVEKEFFFMYTFHGKLM